MQPNNCSLVGKVALVTGSSRGIGRAIAQALGGCGASLIINGRNQNNLSLTHNDLLSRGLDVIMVAADVSDYAQVESMINKAISTYGKIDILVNNAGVSHVGLLTDMTAQQIASVTDINQMSAFYCTKLVLPHMVSQKSGSIINISSVWGSVGASCEAIYAASKAAVNVFTKSIAKEYGSCNIKCNAVSCGVIDTDMNEWLDEQEKNDLISQIPLGRFGSCLEVAELALFLAHSEYITGQVIAIDGGWF